MSIFSKFSAVFGQKASEAIRAITALVPLNRSVSLKADFKAFAEEGYSRNSTVYACIREIAEASAGVPWVLRRRKRDGDMETLEDHPLLSLIERPNPHQGQFELVESMMAFLYLTGNSYMESVGPTVGAPRELYSLRPDRVRVLPHVTEKIGGYEYKVGQVAVRFDPSQILHQKLFHPGDDFYGLSPVQVAALAIDKSNEGDKWNAALLRNSAVPSGTITAKARLTDEQFQRLKTEVRSQIQGADNAREPLLLEDDLSWKEMGITPRDMDWLEGSKMSALQIAQVFNVPPELIGLQTATYQNRKEARKALYTEVVCPALSRLRDGFNNWLTPKFGDDLYLDFDKDGIEALSEDREKLWDRANTSDFLTINEKRALVEYGEVEGGDALLINMNKLSLTDISNPSEEEQGESDSGEDEADGKSCDHCTIARHSEQGEESSLLDTKSFSPSERKKYARLVRVLARARNALRKKYEPKISKLLNAEAKAVATAYRSSQSRGVKAVLESYKQKWTDLLTRLHHDVLLDSAPRALDQLKSWEPDFWETKADALDEAQDLFESLALDYAKENAAESVTNISAATKSKINQIIADATAQGLGVEAVARSLVDRLGDLKKARALSITRTEIHNAQTFAQEEQIKTLDDPDMEKGWFWSGKARTEHSAIDGVWVKLNSSFNVGGKKMSRPGDPSGGAENVINCACTLVFRRKP